MNRPYVAAIFVCIALATGGCASTPTTTTADKKEERVTREMDQRVRSMIQEAFVDDFDRRSPAEFIDTLTNYIEIDKSQLHPSQDQTEKAQLALARVYEVCDRYDESRKIYNDLIEQYRASGGPSSLSLATALRMLAMLEIRAGRFAVSRALASEAVDIYRVRERFQNIAPLPGQADGVAMALFRSQDSTEGTGLIDTMYVLGWADVCEQKFHEALATYNDAVTHAPSLASPYVNRAKMNMVAGSHIDANNDMAKAMKYPLGNHGNEMLNLLWLSRIRVRGKEDANNLIRRLTVNVKPHYRVGYNALVTDYILDNASEASILKGQESQFAGVARRRAAVAHLFIGIKCRLAGNPKAAREHFEQAIATRAYEEICYHLAEAGIQSSEERLEPVKANESESGQSDQTGGSK